VKSIPVILAVSFALASCNQGSDVPLHAGGTQSGTWQVPADGTTYVFQSLRDGVGEETDTLTVVGHERFPGKPNVLLFQISKSDTLFVALETNGDFSFGRQSSDSLDRPIMEWTTFPTSGGRPIVDHAIDTFIGTDHEISSDVRSFVARETMAIAGRTLSTMHVRETSVDIRTSPTIIDSSGSVTDWWFAPSIGFLVKQQSHDSFNGSASTRELLLIQYIPH
jgi:hypothetical protein